jgi:hypothetical protein
MAELFKPEIREVGGSNLTAYTPPSMDYSGVISSIPAIFASAMETKEVKGPTEAEKKQEALNIVASSLERVNAIEDPTRKAIEFKKTQQKALLQFPSYQEDVNKLFGSFTGDVYMGTGQAVQDLQQANTAKWVTDTTEGKAALSYAYITSGGDEAEAQNILTQQYMLSTQKQLQMDQAKLASDKLSADAATKKVEFGLRARPVIQTDISNKFKMDMSPEMVRTIADQAIKQGLDPAVVLLDSLSQARAVRLAEVTTDINKYGLDPKSENPETFLAEYDAQIEAFKANLDIFSRSFKNKNAEQIAQLASKIDNPIIARGIISGDAAVTAYTLEADVKAKSDLVNAIQTSTSIAAGDMSAQTPMAVISNNTVGDSPSAFAEQYKGLAPAAELTKIFSSPPAWRSSIKIATDISNGYKFENESPEMVEAAHRALSTMYIVSLPEIDKAFESMRPQNVRTLMSEKMLSIADSMSKTTPLKGKDLYNKMNNYAANAANILLNNFKTNMDILSDTDVRPFKLNMDANGNITFSVNEVAARTDPRLKKAMGVYRYETKSAGRKDPSKMTVEKGMVETDPVKILYNYATLGTVNNQKEVLDIVESLKILAMQSKKIPVDVRSNGVDTLELIRQGIQ